MMELVNMFPTLEFYPRGTYSLKDIIGYANNRGFSNVVVLNESNKKINGLWMVHLPEGPTAKFKVSGIVLSKEIPNAGRAGGSVPEVILNNFATRSVIFFFFFFFFFRVLQFRIQHKIKLKQPLTHQNLHPSPSLQARSYRRTPPCESFPARARVPRPTGHHVPQPGMLKKHIFYKKFKKLKVAISALVS
jgi:rRNA maturation protein Rpf1